MITDGKKESTDHRPVTGKFSSVNHGIGSISALLLIIIAASLAIPSVGAQPPPWTRDDLPSRFTPSMAVIIAVLVAALFFMGFFSIYIRNCSDSSAIGSVRHLGASMRARRAAAAAARGLDASVIETFPTFVYAEVKGQKIGKGALECAVCLCEFEDDETLRLLPKCDHVFHPECIDEWLSSHVTCPVCRADLVPEPADTIPIADPNTEPAESVAMGRESRDVSVRISDDDDHVVSISDDERPHVVDRNQSLNRNRPLPPRSWSVRSSLFGSKFPRSHSTGHSLVQPGENTDRFTLRLPEDVRKQVMKKSLNRTASCVVVLPREGSSRRGYRAGRPDRLDRSVKSDRWGFSMFTRASSLRSPKVVDGEGTSSTTPKGGSKTAVRMPSFKCLEPKCDETGLLPAGSVKSQI